MVITIAILLFIVFATYRSTLSSKVLIEKNATIINTVFYYCKLKLYYFKITFFRLILMGGQELRPFSGLNPG